MTDGISSLYLMMRLGYIYGYKRDSLSSCEGAIAVRCDRTRAHPAR
jgi:hypothetical protein